MEQTAIIEQLYRTYTGHQPECIEKIPGAGSNRSYFRIKGEPQLIGVCGTSLEENDAFIYLARHFKEKGLPVPQVMVVADDGLSYLQEDLGEESLFDILAKERSNGKLSGTGKELLKRTIRLLPRIQYEGADGLDFSRCYPQSEFNRRSVSWDLNYFKYCFLKATGLEFQEDLLEDDFERLATDLLKEPFHTFMYRDFQSRNIMVKQGMPYCIDFQGGRKGPIHYDVASFLWQAKANFSPALRQELIEVYLEALQPYNPVSAEDFGQRLRLFVLFRLMQVLGAYGFRGYFERKAHFIQSIPYAVENLRVLLESPFAEYPYLCNLLNQVTQLPQFVFERNKRQLTVEVLSFSYKKGIPADPSGNGGGYVFDCRYIHNPGRYEAYKQLTGRDEPVIRFLEERSEIKEFLTHVDALVDAHVQRYLERGFTHLMVCFGCTGGQHRSVYSADHVARHLHERFGVNVHLVHREQHIEEWFNAQQTQL